MNTFKNWSKSSYYIYSIGAIILTILSLTTSAITVYSVLSLIGALFGFLSVVLIVNKNHSAGYVGMVSAIIYMFVSWSLGNYSDTLLNILFIVFLNLPLILNKKYSDKVESTSIRGNKDLKEILVLLFIAIYLSLFTIEVLIFNAPRPIFSVLAATLGIVASIATSFFVLKESAYIWILQNIFQVCLWGVTYYQTDSEIALLMLVTYILYTLNSMCFFSKKWGFRLDV